MPSSNQPLPHHPNAQLTVQLRSHGTIPMDLDFCCAPGEMLALLGPSGSGKTSSLRAIAGLLNPPDMQGQLTLGPVTWFDSAARIHWRSQQRRVGLVFQGYALFPHLTATENIALCADYSGAGAGFLTDIEELLERLGLAGLGARRPAQLSGGQQQRVALARALMRIAPPRAATALGPGVLLLDEPFSAVDAPTRQALYRELASLRQSLSVPMLLVTHDQHEARQLADRVVLLDRGASLQSGTPSHVFTSPRNARAAQLMGLQNHFAGQFFKDAPGLGWLRWTPTPDPQFPPDPSAPPTPDGLQLRVVDKNRLTDATAVTWVLVAEQIDVLALTTRATAMNDSVDATAPPGDPNDNLLVCEFKEILALGETGLCRLAPLQRPEEVLTLTLASSQLRQLGAHLGQHIVLRIPATAIHIMPVRPQQGVAPR